tara:strand:+ start:534 stop:671 length:138 start_codon:yes stop_codon:yes gene_type:complete
MKTHTITKTDLTKKDLIKILEEIDRKQRIQSLKQDAARQKEYGGR